jgi:TPR repeat protein
MKKILFILFLFSGLLYANSFNDGLQSYQNGNYQKAAKLYQKAAEQGNDQAQFNLGIMYVKGEGVKQDKQKGMELFNKAANNGNPDAQYLLGVMYFYGKVMKQDYKKAFELFNKAANNGNLEAQYLLGVMYYNGQGVQQDISLAKEYFKKSCDNGLQKSCRNYKIIETREFVEAYKRIQDKRRKQMEEQENKKPWFQKLKSIF